MSDNSPYSGDILLESGTNEMELIEFTLGNRSFGINVSKVREILIPCPVTPMPHSHFAVEGVIKPRDTMLTVVDLAKYLGIETPEDNDRHLFITTNFNNLSVAFRVHTVVGINRISWESIQKVDKVVYSGADGVATGIADINGKLITILDFEKIVADISPETGIRIDEVEAQDDYINNHGIILAEDSNMLAEMVIECLHKAGYLNVTRFQNGLEAWEYLSSLDDRAVKSKVSLIITDIEMPQMDGHHLTKLIKDNALLKDIPVLIFSSLINDQMFKKGLEVGADAQLSKPEIAKLISSINELIEK